MARLLVTGGAGFIGTNFVRFWRERHPADAIVVLDALTYSGRRENLADLANVEFVHGKIQNFDLVAKLLGERELDTIVNFAAESHVDRSIEGPDPFVDTNVTGTFALLKAAKSVWLDSGSGKPHRFHHISTDEVYGSLGPNDPAFTEDTPFAPSSPYSASKAASDHFVRAYYHTYGLLTSTTNCSNNYGPYQFPEKLIPHFLLNALHDKALPIYGDGQNVRDWLHVTDHCRAIELVLTKGRPGQTYNVGGGQELSNLEVTENICRGVDDAFAQNPDLAKLFPRAPAGRNGNTAGLKTFVKDRLGHDRRYAVDEGKIQRELGYTPEYDFTTGFKQTIAWYLDNREWWQPHVTAD